MYTRTHTTLDTSGLRRARASVGVVCESVTRIRYTSGVDDTRPGVDATRTTPRTGTDTGRAVWCVNPLHESVTRLMCNVFEAVRGAWCTVGQARKASGKKDTQGLQNTGARADTVDMRLTRNTRTTTDTTTARLARVVADIYARGTTRTASDTDTHAPHTTRNARTDGHHHAATEGRRA